MQECEGAAICPPEARRQELPDIVTMMILGAKVYEGCRGRQDAWTIESYDGRLYPLSDEDYDLVCRIREEIEKTRCFDKVVAATQVLSIRRIANMILNKIEDKRVGKKGLIMLRDQDGGSGYWRMVLPGRYMDESDIYIDMTSAPVKFEYLLEYDTIFVQRLHDWESSYLLKKLKAAGKRVVYDIDDDFWHIEPGNPAFFVIGRDQQLAARACMKEADVITVSTGELARRIKEYDIQDIEVILNALDLDKGWIATPLIGSPDGVKRLFYQGGITHNEDWFECIDAVETVMAEDKSVRLTLLGSMLPIIQQRLLKWPDRIEYAPFDHPDTYFEMLKYVRAEAGLAPLKDSYFNGAKSSNKFVEYSMSGMPVVASDVLPYSSVIEHGKNGYLCRTKEDWIVALRKCLARGNNSKQMVATAREKARQLFDIKETVKKWKRVLMS